MLHLAMKQWTTRITALDNDGNLTTWVGPNVPGVSMDDAQAYCEQNGLGYCQVVGEYIPYTISGIDSFLVECISSGRVTYN